MSENKSTLGQVVANNQISVVADASHVDENIPNALKNDLAEAKANGAGVLFLEHDKNDVSLNDLRNDKSKYGEMVREAEKLGYQIELYDDRTAERAYAQQYPNETQHILKHDPYMQDRDALIKSAPDPDKMKEYLDLRRDNAERDLNQRNTTMANNIDKVMQQHPDQKAIAMVGSRHVDGKNDLDEGLRNKGYTTSTMEYSSPVSADYVGGPDKPDFVSATENSATLSYKDPKTQEMKRALSDETLPWKNQEPVAEVSNKQLGELAPSSTPNIAPSREESIQR